MAVDIVGNRLKSKANLAVDPRSLAQRMEEMTRSFSKAVGNLLQMRGPPDEDVTRIALLLGRVNDIQSFVQELKHAADAQSTRVAAGEAPNAVQKESPWDGWMFPTVGWLMSPSWHAVKDLRSVYNNAQDYALTLSQLWTLLTFYWGAGAVWPRCRCQQGGANAENGCGEPLLAAAEGGRCTFRRGNGDTCSGAAAFRCHRRGHDQICMHCLVSRQTTLIGPPSPGASTDVYDANVERETTRREGVVFVLSGLESRKPPKIAPNWNTTYRLQTSALVAVVKLGAHGEKLPRDRAIQWAEVVPVDPRDSNFDWKYRQNGRIALRLLTRGDIPALSTEVESPLDARSQVAIIDLRVFVPEVVSVLATLTNPSFIDNLSHMAFLDRLIGAPSPDSNFLYDSARSIDANVFGAISHSKIEFIHRLDNTKKAILVKKICNLAPVKSLYGTQLEAFTCALSNSLHCTQGPPGTGKVLMLCSLIKQLACDQKLV
jgi:hypothetical protein